MDRVRVEHNLKGGEALTQMISLRLTEEKEAEFILKDDGQFASSGRMGSQCPRVLQRHHITEHEDFPCEAAPSIFSASKIILLKTSTAV